MGWLARSMRLRICYTASVSWGRRYRPDRVGQPPKEKMGRWGDVDLWLTDDLY